MDTRVQFDRIVCDVPCSSDAAIRKIPQKWDKWTPSDGASLHPLQAKILFRGLQLLRVGGKISYSTCSLNPLEDEAVVASALKTFEGKIELERVELPGFRFREGLTEWKVLVEGKREGEGYFEEIQSIEQATSDQIKRGVKETMFASYYNENIRSQLKRCLRVFPHD